MKKKMIKNRDQRNLESFGLAVFQKKKKLSTKPPNQMKSVDVFERCEKLARISKITLFQ